MNPTPERIICAAIHWQNGKEYGHQPKNIESGLVICGRRHHNAILTLVVLRAKTRFGLWRTRRHRIAQGFMTDRGNYYDRRQSMKIALKSNQVKVDNELLFSEDLY
ncbi:hypothetical protein LCGC14_0601040 [marine sediment metagenome]|uniref:Uncharacterized protein n=1 Tax=marine sediment metagenome TaxID=412755 RepID=A0A0F9UJ41_9ZZZZ